jgi:hypothetical protein
MVMDKKLKSKISNITASLLGRKFSYRLRYYHNRGRWPNLKHPQDLSEILISRILTNDFEKYARYADKIEVRKYIIEKGLGDHLLEHYHYWDDASKITWDDLPDKFVLKTSNGAGGKDIFICRDKRTFDLENAKQQLAKALKKEYKYEKQYNVYQPRVICEELIDTGGDAWPTDYKFTCIHGQPVDVFVGTGREQGVKFCTRNLDWSVLNNTKPSYLPKVDPEKPKHLEEMVEIAKILSADFDFVRVDLYEYKDNVYFGELTFSPWGGIMYSYTDEAIKEYGRLLREGNRE